MDTPLVSIIVPTHNRERYLSRCLDSVLSQTYSNWELIIVDDASTDRTRDIVGGYMKDLRVKYLRNDSNAGIHKAVHRGFQETQGVYVARLDDDDEWIDRDKLSRQVEFLEKNKDCVLVGTGMIVVDSGGEELFRYLLPETDEGIRLRMLGKNCFANSTVMFRRDVAVSVGGYQTDSMLRYFEDYDLWLRLGQKGKLHNLPIYGTRYMVHHTSITSQNKREHLRVNIALVRKYGHFYPHKYVWLLSGYVRLFLYEFYVRIPFTRLKNFLFKKYKEF